jgi:uncharacterized repeat protein (TIGR03833 family)
MPRRGGQRQPARGEGGGQRSNGKQANASLIGSHVSVIQKQDQPTGRLTAGTVAEILTNSEFHPRGIKVRLTDGTVGRISTGVGGATAEPMHASHPGAAAEASETLTRPAPSLADFISFPVLPPTSTTRSAAADATTAVAEEQTSWACPVCTFANSGFLTDCEMCQSARD